MYQLIRLAVMACAVLFIGQFTSAAIQAAPRYQAASDIPAAYPIVRIKTLICEAGQRECIRRDLDKYWCCPGHLDCSYEDGEMGCRKLNTKIFEDDDNNSNSSSKQSDNPDDSDSNSSSTPLGNSDENTSQNNAGGMATSEDCPDYIPKGKTPADFPKCSFDD